MNIGEQVSIVLPLTHMPKQAIKASANNGNKFTICDIQYLCGIEHFFLKKLEILPGLEVI